MPLPLAVWVGQEGSSNHAASSVESLSVELEENMKDYSNQIGGCPVRHVKNGEGGLINLSVKYYLVILSGLLFPFIINLFLHKL